MSKIINYHNEASDIMPLESSDQHISSELKTNENRSTARAVERNFSNRNWPKKKLTFDLAKHVSSLPIMPVTLANSPYYLAYYIR